MSTPTQLYKYEAFSMQSLENLKNQIVYFGSPKKFNEPYDSALFPTIRELSDEDIEKLRSHYLAKADISDNTRLEFKTLSTGILREKFLIIGQDTLEGEIEKFISNQGVSCFSKNKENILMWSHYAGKHSGFCLEFSPKTELFHKIREVKYLKAMPSIDLVRMLCYQDYDQIIDLFCSKSEDWKYEEEWRAIHEKSCTAFHYPAEALIGIYFGARASVTSIEIAGKILADQNVDARMWQGSISKTEFLVVFEPVNLV